MNKDRIIISICIIAAAVVAWFVYLVEPAQQPLGDIDNTIVQSQVTAEGERFSGVVTAYDTGCFADGECSITIDDKKVILLSNSIVVGEQPLGELVGVESMGDLETRIGAQADVYAAPTESGDYTLYGDSDFFVELK